MTGRRAAAQEGDDEPDDDEPDNELDDEEGDQEGNQVGAAWAGSEGEGVLESKNESVGAGATVVTGEGGGDHSGGGANEGELGGCKLNTDAQH